MDLRLGGTEIRVNSDESQHCFIEPAMTRTSTREGHMALNNSLLGPRRRCLSVGSNTNSSEPLQESCSEVEEEGYGECLYTQV